MNINATGGPREDQDELVELAEETLILNQATSRTNQTFSKGD